MAGVSTRLRPIAAMAGLGALATTIVIGVAVGSVTIPLSRTTAILWALVSHGGVHGAPSWDEVVITAVRLPRTLLAVVCGGGLAVAGTAMQGLFRNPMADPGVLGVSAGASLGAVLALYLTPAAVAPFAVPAAAFCAALACTALVYALGTRQGHTALSTLLLAGIAVAGIASALTSFVLSAAVADWEIGKQLLDWLMGGLDGRTWTHVAMVTPLVLAGSAWLVAYARPLDVLLTGEESALSLGVDVPRVKRRLLALTALVTAATVAVMGVVGFVGLMVPHLVRLLVGPRHARVFPLAFVVGGVVLSWADIACRTLPLAGLRLGVLTSLAGGPFFLYLLVRHRAELRVLG